MSLENAIVAFAKLKKKTIRYWSLCIIFLNIIENYIFVYKKYENADN